MSLARGPACDEEVAVAAEDGGEDPDRPVLRHAADRSTRNMTRYSASSPGAGTRTFTGMKYRFDPVAVRWKPPLAGGHAHFTLRTAWQHSRSR